MPLYQYRAIDHAGKIVTGEMTVDSQDAVAQQLRRQQLRPMDIRLGGSASHALASGSLGVQKTGRRKKRASAEDVLFFTSKLALLLRSGLPLVKAMNIMKGMVSNVEMSAVRENVLDQIKAGAPLSEALLRYPKLFSPLYVNMVRAGEQGGNLDKVLGELTEHLERAKELRSSVVSALIYPAILSLVAFLSVFLLLGFVVPRFEVLFRNMGQALPLPTQIVVGLGHFTAQYGWVFVVIAVIAVIAWQRASQRPAFRVWKDGMALRLPLFGSLLVKYETTIFSRTLGTLLESGVPVIKAVPIAVETLGNTRIRGAMSKVQDSIKEGGRLSDTLENTGLFSEMGVQMIRVGEESGRVEEMLLDLARVYDADVQQMIKRGLTLLEPVLILGLGTVIGAIITSILLGILSVNNLAT
ncbi:MAG: type II secretion system F family protein [Halothiobacillus sp.]